MNSRFLREPDSLDGYWAAVHPTLSRDYTVPSKTWYSSEEYDPGLPQLVEPDCGELADVIAGELAKTGIRTKILELSSPLDNGAKATLLKPNLAEADLEWLVHYVCADGDTVYDPILPTPMPYNEYVIKVFGEQPVISRVIEG